VQFRLNDFNFFDMNYSEKLKSPHWQKKRLKILSRDEFTCQYCFDKDTQLQVHHLKYEGNKPEETNSDYLITLCEDCHTVVEVFKGRFELIRTVKQQCIHGKLIFAACSDLKVRLIVIPNGYYKGRDYSDVKAFFFATVNTDLIKF